ncbi:MAG: MarR family transcriptional regulator [Oscillospiraceae bacterium]|nr:MarR family transcriptional regulator [Oscillospiraceae bacterium]
MENKNIPPADMLINDIAKMFDDSIRKKSTDFPSYETFGGNKGFGARHILFYLAEHKDEKINQLALAKFTHLTPPTISIALRNMEEQALIVRRQNPKDMRETFVQITEKGEEFYRFIKQSICEVRKIMFAGIPDEQIMSLSEALLKIKENMIRSEEKNDKACQVS